MSRHTNESPMDFEFQNGTGPLDGRSPFAQVSINAQRYPPGASSPAKKRTHSVFDSPSKTHPMGGQQSSPAKPLPPAPAFKNTLFNTPRKPLQDFEDSSAGETPRSPEPNDSDATPEITKRKGAMIMFDNTQPGAERFGPSKERPDAQRSDSFMRKCFLQVKNKVYSPGRGELVPRKDHHAGAIEKSARRRKREVDHRVRKRRRSASDSGDDHGHLSASPRKMSGQIPEGEVKPHWVSSLFTFIAHHPTLPNTLSQYAQFVFNLFWLSLLAYIMYCFWSAVQGDVDKKANEHMSDIIADIAKCGQDYHINNCDPATRVPHMQTFCIEWKKCMERDPRKVGRANVSAQTFAQIFNSFVEPISYKAMIFTCILVFGCFAISNFAFGFFRHRMMQDFQPNYGYNAPPPPTPQRAFSDGVFYTGTPWHQPPIGSGFEPQPSGGLGQIEGQGSPVRRLIYN